MCAVLQGQVRRLAFTHVACLQIPPRHHMYTAMEPRLRQLCPIYTLARNPTHTAIHGDSVNQAGRRQSCHRALRLRRAHREIRNGQAQQDAAAAINLPRHGEIIAGSRRTSRQASGLSLSGHESVQTGKVAGWDRRPTVGRPLKVRRPASLRLADRLTTDHPDTRATTICHAHDKGTANRPAKLFSSRLQSGRPV